MRTYLIVSNFIVFTFLLNQEGKNLENQQKKRRKRAEGILISNSQKHDKKKVGDVVTRKYNVDDMIRDDVFHTACKHFPHGHSI